MPDVPKQNFALMVENRRQEIDNMVRIEEGLNKEEKIFHEQVTWIRWKYLN